MTVQLQTPLSKHVVLVMEENQSFDTVVGNSNVWPNLNNLIRNGALPTNYYANSHPSIGNYFMLTTYVGGNTGLYLIRHDPFAMLSDVASNPQVANETIWPFSQFATDLANGTLPEFSYIVPDVDDDAHNGTPQQADTWLQTNVVVPLSNFSAFQLGGDGVLIVDFDEAADSDSTNGGGHVAPVLWGPIVKVGYMQTSAALYQHQSMLRTMVEALQLANPPGAAASAPEMSEFFVQK
ncbi:MAG: alkaline phosphatase family protein [Candidatus Sulfotelmatobacter sp.]